jgi:hypothetical protein
MMLKFLSPGDLISDAVGLPRDSENRMIFRMFINTLVWGGLAILLMILILR